MKKTPALVLIGMPGSGKTTIGKLLASTLNMRFIDSDHLIECAHQKPLQQIVNQLSIEEFIQVESTTIRQLKHQPAVVATGGSVIFCPQAMQHLQNMGAIIYLNCEVTTLQQRINNFNERGLINTQGGIEEMHRLRTPKYQQYATITIGNNGSAEAAVAKISTFYQQRLQASI